MGGNVFGQHRRERIAFSGKFGDAGLGCLKKGLGRRKKVYLRAKLGEAKACLELTGASGSLFFWSYCNHRKSARNSIEAEAQAYVKD